MNRAIPNEPGDSDSPPRLPPWSTAAEEGLIGACLQGRAAIDAAREHTTPADLHSTGLGEILHAILTIDTEGDKVDAFTVAAHLGTTTTERLGGIKKLTGLEMAGNVATAARHARTIRDLAQKRRLWQALTDASEAILDGDDLEPVTSRVGDHLLAITTSGRKTTYTGSEIAADAMREVEHRYEGGGTIIPVPWERMATTYGGGYRPGEFHVLGARPGVGKTQTALTIAVHAADHGRRVLFASLEMTHVELGIRVLGFRGPVLLDRLRTGKLGEQEWSKVGDAVTGMPDLMWCHDDPAATVSSIAAAARRYQPDLVVIDYLQLLASDTKTENRTQEMSAMTRSLKRLAGQQQCAVLALSQLNRGVEGRMEKKPTLSDLRESGQIEADADSVAFLWRDKEDRDGLIRLEVAKQRSGSTGEIRLVFDGTVGTIRQAAA